VQGSAASWPVLLSAKHLFVTSQGSAHGRFTGAIQQRNLWAAESFGRFVSGFKR